MSINNSTANFECIIEQSGTTVVFKILDSTNIKRGAKGKPLIFTASNGFSVKSQTYPELQYSGICIRGFNIAKDSNWSLIEFNTVEEAETYYEKVVAALAEWNGCGCEFNKGV